MGYQGRKGPIDYKGYGQKKKPGRQTRYSKRGVVLLLLVLAVCLWLLIFARKKEEDTDVPRVVSFPQRQNIYDRNLEPLAVSFELYAAYIKPLEVQDSRQTGEVLAAILDLDQEQLIHRLRTERSFVWLGHHVQPDKVAEMAELEIAGLYFQKSPVRYYPHNETAAQVIGYVREEQGLAGVELFYDKELRSRTVPSRGSGVNRQSRDQGKHIILTLDLKIQTILEKQMAALLDKTQATSVAAMAVDSATGGIVASVQLPSFNPNAFWEASPQSQKMEMVSKAINPGGISGIFRYGAAVHADRSTAMPVMESPSAVVLSPRVQKSGGRARAGYWWPWPGQGYISTELAELPDPSISEEMLLAFQQDLGIGCADQLDVPVKAEDTMLASGTCPEGRLNGVSILGAFSRLVNGGRPVALHFLKGTVDGQGTFSSYQFEAPGRDVAKVSAMLQSSFGASAGSNAPFFAAEYLHPLEKEELFVVADEVSDQSAEMFEGGQNYDGLLVAAAPVDKPNMVLLISVQDGEFDLAAASPMRRFADGFFRLAARQRPAQGNEGVSATALLPALDELLLQWQGQDKKGDKVPVARQKNVGLVPDVIGMSLRKAMWELKHCRVEVEIAGAGRVVKQEPAPGSECGSRIRLQLAADSVDKTP